MRNAIILHGGPSKKEYYDPETPSMSNAHWIPWLQGQLLKHDIPTATPEVPWSFDRNWKVWLKEVERFDIVPETILIGHSTGAGFWIKYLSINKKLKVDKVVLVAPWLDPDKKHTKNFFDDFEHPNKKRYPLQRILVVAIENYAYYVPYVEDKEKIFLKTIFPSRRATKKYLYGGENK